MERWRLTRMRRDDIRLFSSDIDGTLVGDPEATWRFAKAWRNLDSGTRPLLVYNTARLPADTLALAAARGLPEPDYIIGGLGTELYDSLYLERGEFRRRLDTAWDAKLVDDIVATMAGTRRQPCEFANDYKSSWYWDRAQPQEVAGLRNRLKAAGLRAKVVYSCHYFLDIIPASAGKGTALMWLCERLAIPSTRVLVAGDTGNDAEMFQIPSVKGILVHNALAELRSAANRTDVYASQSAMADGVIEGLRHFGVINGEPDRQFSGMTVDVTG